MKIKVKLTLLILLLSIQFSCNKWMELIPPEGLIRDEFWKTKEDVEAVLMGAYETFASMDGALFRYGELRGDMVAAGSNLGDSERKIMEGSIYPDNYICDWSNFYKVINYCNEVIKNGPIVRKIDDTFTDYQLQGYLSEAIYLRSLAYFYLVRIFKDVPYITQPTESDDADFYVPKSDGDEILNNLLEDLEEYRKYATIDGYITLEELKGRVTRAAYDALLADINLWMFNYDEVLRHTAKIDLLDKYQIMRSNAWFDIFFPGNSIESIFEFQFDDALNQKNSLYGMTQRFSYSYLASKKAIDYFKEETVRNFSIRKYSETEYIIWKYVGKAADIESFRSGSDQNSANWIIYRSTDVWLMMAEALSQLERFDEARSILYLLEDNVSVPRATPANTVAAFEDAIMEERALSLAFEGKRWFDLMRMGRRNDFARKSKLIDVVVQSVPSTQKRILQVKLTNPLGWYLPIHEDELERNKALVQNPYYNF